MPTRAKGARLYLRKRRGRESVWVIRDGAGEHSTGCGAGSRSEAERLLARHIAAKYQPKPRADLTDILVAEVVATYLSERGPHVARRDFLSATATPIIAWWGDRTLATIRGETCRQYVTWRVAQGVSDQTARHDLKTMRAAINHWHREYGPLTAVPAVTLPTRSEPKDRYLTQTEAGRMLRATKRGSRLRRFALIALHTGTRRSAVLGLSWMPALHTGWIDLEAGIIHRKGAAERATKKSRPPCRIPERLLPWLRRWKALDLAKGQTMVCPYSVRNLRRAWGVARTRAKLGRDVTPHVLRHTCVTWQLQRGVPPAEVASFVGMSLDMVDRVYGHLGPEHQQKAARR